MSEALDSFDWGDLGEDFWRALAKSAGVSSELALRFFVAKRVAGSITNTEAARRAGAGGEATASGYRLSRARDVARLADRLDRDKGPNLGGVSNDEALGVIAEMIRAGDPQTRARGLELNLKYEEKKREAVAAEYEANGGGDPIRTLNEIHALDPLAAFVLARAHNIATWKLPGGSVSSCLFQIDRLRQEIADEARGRGDDHAGDQTEARDVPTRSAAEQSEGPTQSAA
jgi:hypothetical protein